MAGVDHAYQYSVEVKSRFSLFLDDALSSEDPDILLSKLQTKRTEKTKKEKSHVQQQQQQQATPVKVDTVIKNETKVDSAVPKAAPQPSKSPGSTEIPRVPPEDMQNYAAKEAEEPVSTFSRGRGLGRGAPRGMRAGRGQGPRMLPTETPPDFAGDLNTSRGTGFDSRGRGRGRGRATYGRGRGMPFNSSREFDHQNGPDRQGPRQYGRRDGNWNPQEADGQAAPEGGDAEQAVRLSEDQTAVGDGLERPQPEAEEEANGATETPVEEEPKSYTLEEYKAMRQSAKPAVILSNKNLRKANDGKDVFANMVAHRKIQETHEDDDEVDEKEDAPQEHQSIDIDFSFVDEFGNRRRGGGRGFDGRGSDRGRRGVWPRGERGGRGRGQLRGDGRGRGFGRVLPSEDHIPPPAIYSDQEFPSLKHIPFPLRCDDHVECFQTVCCVVMAGVDHAYQYSVEVKSRFSLFLDDALSSEDPDILLSKLQTKRTEKTKKEKSHVQQQQQQQATPVKVDTVIKNETKVDSAVPKAAPQPSKSPGSTEIPRVPPEDMQNYAAKEAEEPVSTFSRGRGLGRGAPRGMRAGRGQGPRMLPTETPPDFAGDLNTSRGTGFDSRGRGRGRGRATYGRGRGMPFNSSREFDHQNGPDRQGPRQYGRRDGNWNPQEADGQAAPEGGDAEQAVRLSEDQTAVGDGLERPQPEAEEEANGATETPVEEEPKSYTLEEYKAMRQSAKPAVILSNKNLRKANDGKDVFANMVAHRKIQETHEDDDEVDEKEDAPQVSYVILHSR
ncbi:unnamed protein product [Heterobilharzia americana]|nr:unnamed protein product [Heterobilharzia americana]